MRRLATELRGVKASDDFSKTLIASLVGGCGQPVIVVWGRRIEVIQRSSLIELGTEGWWTEADKIFERVMY